jgi:hypothetical protein
MRTLFNVHYAVITPESAESGEADEVGIADENMSLRDAIQEVFRTRTNEVDGVQCIEANCDPLPTSGWLQFFPFCTVYNGMEFRTGAHENRSITPAGRITASSWRRVVQLVKGR